MFGLTIVEGKYTQGMMLSYYFCFVLPTVISILNPFGSGLWSFIAFSWLFQV